MSKVERDEISGTETTGHEWDGIKELNTPLPKWWLNIFYATVAGAVVYWVLFPAWPLISSNTPGILGHSDRANVAADLGKLNEMRAPNFEKLKATPLDQVQKDPELSQFALAAGHSAFEVNCAQCHGQGAQGFVGYPNLNDDDWLWGGTVEQIKQTITYGIRNEDPNTRMSMMQAFGRDGVLTPGQIGDLVSYIRKLSAEANGNWSFDEVSAARGETVFKENCLTCHNTDLGANPDDLSVRGKGNSEMGAPNLTDGIWLYGGSVASLTDTLTNGRGGVAGRGGVMPPWNTRLDEATIAALTVYVHGLGGGK
jgi:cytochrome c oxidase cbb3-type subunit III